MKFILEENGGAIKALKYQYSKNSLVWCYVIDDNWWIVDMWKSMEMEALQQSKREVMGLRLSAREDGEKRQVQAVFRR